MSNSDWSPYATRAILSNAKAREKVRKAIQLHMLNLELIKAKRHHILRDYPEMQIAFDLIEKDRIETEKVWDQLTAYDQ